MGGGGVTPLSCLGSTLGCIRSAGAGVVDLDWPGVVYVLACIQGITVRMDNGVGFQGFSYISCTSLYIVCA